MSRAGLSSAEARDMYRQVLAGYLAGAVLMPYDAFLAAARDLRHDIELLGRRFEVSFEQACHRLTTLHRPGAEGVPFHFLRVDIAGNISKRFNGSGLRIPRFGGACPRWNLHAAFLTPGRLCRQLVRLPEGATYIFLARAVQHATPGFGKPAAYISTSIGCDASFAGQLIYADDLNLDQHETSHLIQVGNQKSLFH